MRTLTSIKSVAGQGGGPVVRRAFSLVEILVTMSLLSFIVLGLLMMFNQTQRAFRQSMTQVDVLESGRLITDMLVRELEQMAPAKSVIVDGPNEYPVTNFFCEFSTHFGEPLRQGLPGNNPPGSVNRTNYIQHFFFLTHRSQDWTANGYVLIPQNGTAVGSLYRYTLTLRPPFNAVPMHLMVRDFRIQMNQAINLANANFPVTNLSRIADGIVHLRVRTFSANGQPLLALVGSTNLVYRLPDLTLKAVENTSWTHTPYAAVDNNYFVYDAVPGSVELELGVLEPSVVDRYRSMSGNDIAQRNYLSNRVGNVHIFRQRIPIRNVDTSVYQ